MRNGKTREMKERDLALSNRLLYRGISSIPMVDVVRLMFDRSLLKLRVEILRDFGQKRKVK